VRSFFGSSGFRKTVALGSALILILAASGIAAAEENNRAAVQQEVESGSDLSPRAQKVLFSSRTRQDDGNFEEAAELLRQWISDHPDQGHHLLYFNLAVSQLELSQPAAALKNLEQSVALEPRFARGWLRLGEAAYDLQNYARAAEAFARGHSLMTDPLPEIRYYSAVAWLLAEKPDKAFSGLKSLLKDHEDSATLDWYQALIAAASESEQFDEARPWVHRCLVENESDARAWYLAYQFAAAAEDYRMAAIRLTVVSYLRPLTRNEFLLLGNMYSGIGVPLQAARYFARALDYPETEPNPDDYLRLASSWMAAHQLDEARKVLNRGIAAGATVKLLALLGDLNYSEKKYTDARAVFGQCTALDPSYGRGWLMSGYCSLELDEKDKARASFKQALKFPAQKNMAEDLLKRVTR